MSVTVLMYHHVLEKSGFIASSVDEFRSHMKFLAENGYKTLSINEFIAYKKGKLEVPKKSVCITFDDGWMDNYVYAYPIVKEFGLKANLFIVTGWIEAAQKAHEISRGTFLNGSHSECKNTAPSRPQDVILNLEQIEKMSDCFYFHSHTHGHFDNYFGQLSLDEEFGLCREFMKKNFGFEDDALCWPRGKYNDKYLSTAKKHGYNAFFTTKRGINKADGNLEEIKRIVTKRDEKWLKKTMFIYQNNFLGSIYAFLRS